MLRLAATLSLAAGLLFAQPEIGVVSVKPGNPYQTRFREDYGPKRVVLTDWRAKMLLFTAFHIREYQLSGTPDWMLSDLWSIEMTTTAPAPKARMDQLMQKVLADRFQLRFHREQRRLPVFFLIVAKGGPKFRKARGADEQHSESGTGEILVRDYDMKELASLLSYQLSAPVIDTTGLTGNYDYQLRWSEDDADADGPEDQSHPTLFTAIKEQLGLELKAGKGPVNVFVIDRIEKPSPN